MLIVDATAVGASSSEPAEPAARGLVERRAQARRCSDIAA
jgi:hypothetical protein